MDENTTTTSLNSIWWDVAPQKREPFNVHQTNKCGYDSSDGNAGFRINP
jgi:hypothetical protein